MKPARPLDTSRAAKELRHYVYLTDGSRAVLLRQVTWHDDDIYLTDPNDPSAGKVSWHETGKLNLGQPLYSPQKVALIFPPPSAVHGYASPLHSRLNSHGLDTLLSRPEKYPPSPGRPSTFIDGRNQPPNTRLLAYEVGVRCGITCHAEANMPTGLGLVQELIPNGDRFLVISAWWEPLIELSRQQFETFLRAHGVVLENPNGTGRPRPMTGP
jgi:hypothetical protein